MANNLVLPVPSGFAINGNRVTDHNRSEIAVNFDRIENRKRMANGTMRNFVVAQKRKIGANWDDLPGESAKTVDGFWGAYALRDFYNSTHGEFTLTLSYGDGTSEDILVMFSDFSLDLKKRGTYTDLYSLDISFEEV